jgi:ubiquinone/menaquinone biosynthesis C-methylase UbiE
MRRPTFIAEQAREPRGLVGRVLLSIMSRETATENEATLRLLKVEPTDRILEVGFGHGKTLERAARLAHRGMVLGVDISETCVRQASHRCSKLIDEGRVRLELGDCKNLPYADASFDKAYSVNTIYFWPNPKDQLGEIARLLRPSGRLALGFRCKAEKVVRDFPASIYRFYAPEEILALLDESGFEHLELRNPLEDSPHFSVAVGQPRSVG